MIKTAETAVPVNSLFPDRYNLQKSSVYKALTDLKINTFKEDKGKTKYITFQQLSALDEYMDILKMSGRQTAETFASEYAQKTATAPAIAPANLLSESSTEFSSGAAMLALANAISLHAQPVQADPLAPQKHLQEACTKGWVLSTAQVREIVGMKSWHGQMRYGFCFQKEGRVGNQSGWLVLKDSGVPES